MIVVIVEVLCNDFEVVLVVVCEWVVGVCCMLGCFCYEVLCFDVDSVLVFVQYWGMEFDFDVYCESVVFQELGFQFWLFFFGVLVMVVVKVFLKQCELIVSVLFLLVVGFEIFFGGEF